MTELTPAQRRELRARAHHLNPVVSIAGNGLTPAVLAEIERSLQAHELIKIKVHGAERDAREALLASLCAALDAAPVQHIGTILVVWRERRDDESAGPADKGSKVSGDKRPSKAKSARAFAATARRSALAQAAADKKRLAARSFKPRARKRADDRDG
ncbi:MAG TPA: YhbY family RNA-binding protein [Rhodocyclaceae bacterium]|nr:YhbY family RNA-binding protein [Rhodocyclaceae bacterium]